MTAAPTTTTTTKKTMTPKERLQIIEKEMQNVILTHFESHFSRNLDAEDALSYANLEANAWFTNQIAMHGSRELQDYVNARKFDKVKFLERFAKIDAAMEMTLQVQMPSRLVERGMNVTKATTMADREGKKYHDGKQLLAARLALDENAKKAVGGLAGHGKPKSKHGGGGGGGHHNKGETTQHKARPAARA